MVRKYFSFKLLAFIGIFPSVLAYVLKIRTWVASIGRDNEVRGVEQLWRIQTFFLL